MDGTAQCLFSRKNCKATSPVLPAFTSSPDDQEWFWDWPPPGTTKETLRTEEHIHKEEGIYGSGFRKIIIIHMFIL